jgi:FtsP/CotA-like multicopper oxidase with cupredoxin domain
MSIPVFSDKWLNENVYNDTKSIHLLGQSFHSNQDEPNVFSGPLPEQLPPNTDNLFLNMTSDLVNGSVLSAPSQEEITAALNDTLPKNESSDRIVTAGLLYRRDVIQNNTLNKVATNLQNAAELSKDQYTVIYPFSGAPGQGPNEGNGSQTQTFDSLNINQKRIYLGQTDSGVSNSRNKPNDSDANHGGIVLKGAKDHYLIYDQETNAWLSSENINFNCDLGLYSCDQKFLDKYNLILGTPCVPGQIKFGGDGGFNHWRIEEEEDGSLVAKFKRLDGYVVKKIVKEAPPNAPPLLAGVDNYTEKRGLTLENKYYNIETELNTTFDSESVEAGEQPIRRDNMHYKSFNAWTDPSAELIVNLNLSSEQCFAAGKFVTNAAGYNNIYGGPLLIVRPGDRLTMNIKNSDNIFSDLPPWNDAVMQYYKIGHQHIIPYDPSYPEHPSYCVWMGHPMSGPTVNNHFHGVGASPSGISDNILRLTKPNMKLPYSYDLPTNHPGGLYWYHSHIHGTSTGTIGRGAAGLIFIQGPYQQYLDNLGIRRQFLQFQRLNLKDAADQSVVTWWDYSAYLPADVYQVDGSNNWIPPQTFKPISYKSYCENNNDYGPIGLCGCAAVSKTTINGLNDGTGFPVDNNAPPSTGVYWKPLINAQMQPVINIHPNELQIFTYINVTTITFCRLSIEGHYIVIVGKDGIPSYLNNFNTNAVDPDSIFAPRGQYLNYASVGPGERIEFFVIPHSIDETYDRTFAIRLDPIDQTELFANDANNDYFISTGGALVGSILLATLKYDGDDNEIEDDATNSISNFLANIDNNTYTNTSPAIVALESTSIQNDYNNTLDDYNVLGYIQEQHINDIGLLKQTFDIVDISAISGFRNYTDAQSFSTEDPVYNVVQITLDPTNLKHFFTVYDGRVDPENKFGNIRQSVIINEQSYDIFAVPSSPITDSQGNDISEWIFYILDDASQNILNAISGSTTLDYPIYTSETQSIPIVAIDDTLVTTKYAHRLTVGDILYFDDNQDTYTVLEVPAYNQVVLSDKVDEFNTLNFDTLNIKSEYLYLYSQELYTNNNTYLDEVPFFNNNGTTFDCSRISGLDTLSTRVNAIFKTDEQDPNNTSIAYTKIISRRNIYYSFSNKIGNAGEGSTQVDGQKYTDDIKDTALVNCREEWLVENHTDVVHYHHQHVNDFQVCGYTSEAAGFNITKERYGSIVDDSNNYIPGDRLYSIQHDSEYLNPTNSPLLKNPLIQNPVNPESAYRYQNEIYVPFYGHEDTVAVPIGRGSTVNEGNLTGIVDAPYGLRGRLRIRFSYEDYTGLFVHHCHLLDDQDMGMMKPIEVVGVDITGNNYYPAPNVDRVGPAGVKTDYYNNIWTVQPG